jgi:hypothetical protein
MSRLVLVDRESIVGGVGRGGGGVRNMLLRLLPAWKEDDRASFTSCQWMDAVKQDLVQSFGVHYK